jgi:hypothetical protein
MNLFLVDTNVHYPTQIPSNYQQTEINNYPQQWPQQQQPSIPIQSDLSQLPPPTNTSFYQPPGDLSQIPAPTNTSFYQPPGDQSQYIQPGFTSTPNSYASQQPWYGEQRERLPSNEVCIISSKK